MSVRWLYLSAAIVLLLPPLPFSSEVQRSILSFRRRALADSASAARVWQNWVDLARAALGVYLLINWAIVTDPAVSGAELKGLSLQSVVLALVLLVQTVRLVRTIQILAPVFYLCGLTLGLSAYVPGLFAVAVGWLFAIGGKNLIYQLPAMLVALAAGGYVLGLAMTTLLLNCALIGLPPLLATLFRKPLLFAATSPTPA